MTATATLTPYDLSDTEKIGKRTYRKQILPIGEITYKGQKIKFDKGFLTDLAASFKAGAYDQVPFVLADAENRHHMNPEAFRGEVAGMEVTEDGLDAIVQVSKEGAKILEDNPRLGVSARIVQGLEKADGRSFKRAVQHVLGTMDPKVTGLRPWQAVDLSVDDEDVEVVDLTAEIYTQEEDAVADETTQDKGGVVDIDLSALSDEEFLALLDMSEDEDETDGETVVEVTVEDEGDEDDEAETDDDDESDGDEADGGEPVTPSTTELSNAVLDDEGRDEMAAMRLDLANERFKSERTALLHAGVPKALIDLAEPLLATPDPVVLDLSNSDDPVNATEIVRGILNQAKGYVPIKPEVGHSVDLSETVEDSEAALLAQWDAEYGKA